MSNINKLIALALTICIILFSYFMITGIYECEYKNSGTCVRVPFGYECILN